MTFYVMKKVVIDKKYKANNSLVSFLTDLPRLFDQEGEMIHDERNIIKKFTVSGVSFVVKSYKRPLFIQRIVYTFFRKTKAKRAYHNARKIRARGIDTPHEIAFIEVCQRGLFADGYLATEINTNPDIAGLLVNKGEDFCKELAVAFAYFVVELHSKGILHHDLNSTNVLFTKENEKYHFSLIDINRMKIYPEGMVPNMNEWLKNLNRFTWEYPLFEFVLSVYARKRNWDVSETLDKALKLKKRFESNRHRTKSFFRIFKSSK